MTQPKNATENGDKAVLVDPLFGEPANSSPQQRDGARANADEHDDREGQTQRRADLVGEDKGRDIGAVKYVDIRDESDAAKHRHAENKQTR